MKYSSSRGRYPSISAAEAITMGIAPDGGLFVPDRIPQLKRSDWEEMANQNYQQRACHILQLFLEEFSSEEPDPIKIKIAFTIIDCL